MVGATTLLNSQSFSWGKLKTYRPLYALTPLLSRVSSLKSLVDFSRITKRPRQDVARPVSHTQTQACKCITHPIYQDICISYLSPILAAFLGRSDQNKIAYILIGANEELSGVVAKFVNMIIKRCISVMATNGWACVVRSGWSQLEVKCLIHASLHPIFCFTLFVF